MRIHVIRTTCALIGSLIIAPAASANAPWVIQTGASRWSTGSTPAEVVDFGVSIIGPPALPPDFAATSGSFTTPDGKSTGTFTSGGGTGTDEYYSDFAQFQSNLASTAGWSLTATQGSTTSVYQFLPDLSSIHANLLPTSAITTPLSQPLVNRQPTFNWTDTGEFSTLYLQVFGIGNGVSYAEYLPLDQTSWTAPGALPNGVYNIYLQAGTSLETIPLRTTLVSGPDLDLPASTNFQFNAQAIKSFTIVPEPSSLAMGAVGMLLSLHRRRGTAIQAFCVVVKQLRSKLL